MGDRWHATVRETQTSRLDDEADARGVTRSEIFLTALILGLDQLRAQRLVGRGEPTTSSVKSEPKASDTSRGKSSEAKPSKTKAPRRPAKPAAVPAVDLSSVIRPVDGLAQQTPPQSQPAASTDAALKDLGLTETEVGENPFDCLNDDYQPPPKRSANA